MALRVVVGNGVGKVAGSIDESASFAPLVGSGVKDIDWQGVTSINSYGVRAFLDFAATWSQGQMRFHRCPAVLVDAFVLVPALLGPEASTAEIVSLEVPYDCVKCDVDFPVLLDRDELEIQGARLNFPAQTCSICGSPAEASEDAQNYIDLASLGAFGRKAVTAR